MAEFKTVIRTGLKYVPSNTETNVLVQLKPQKQGHKPDTLFFILTVFSGMMVATIAGCHIVWTSPVIPKLTSNFSDDNPLGRTITPYEISMIAGLPPLACLVGSLFLGQLAEIFGRKRSIIIMALGEIVGTIFLAFSSNVYSITFFRCMIFMFFNAATTIYPVYLTEICEDHNRARYGCLMCAMLPLGNLFGYTLGSFFTFRIFTLSLLSPMILFIFFFIYAPESPVYSLSRGKREESLNALRKLRSNKSDKELEDELSKIEEALKMREKSSTGNILTLFSTKEKRYATLLACGPPFIQALSGVGILLQFMAPIFIAAGTNLNSNYLTILVSSIKLASILTTSSVVEKTGRRYMLLISSVGCSIPLLTLGGYFYLKSINSQLLDHLQLVPLISVIAFMVTYSVGIGPIPMAIMGELFTSDVRAAGVSFIMTVMGICMFCSTSSFPFITHLLGLHWCFWMYSVICLAGATFIYFMIPETKGKDLVQLQEYIRSRVNK